MVSVPPKHKPLQLCKFNSYSIILKFSFLNRVELSCLFLNLLFILYFILQIFFIILFELTWSSNGLKSLEQKYVILECFMPQVTNYVL